MLKEDFSVRDQQKIDRANQEMQKAIASQNFDKIVDIRLWQCGYSYSDWSSGGDGGTSDVVASLVSAGTQLGTTEILASQAPQTLAAQTYSPIAGNALAATGSTLAIAPKSSIFLWLILAIVAIFVYKEIE